jgi:small subunit ribosomal protein S9
MAAVKLLVGRRKTAVARVKLVPGGGKILINGREINQYFTVPRHLLMATAPLRISGSEGKFDINAKVNGGGITGQAGAVSLGISRALNKFDVSMHTDLKRAGLLRRDPRMVERKKYGFHKARRGTQFSKR